MNRMLIDSDITGSFKKYLENEEKSPATVEKYIRDVSGFADFLRGREDPALSREAVVAYKQLLLDSGYAVRSVNSMLASLNSLLVFLGRDDLRLKALRLQQEVFRPEEKELSRAEYERLCLAARRKNNERLFLVLQTICSTGIRVGERPFITAEAVRSGRALVSLKGKTRTVFILSDLQKKLLHYMSLRDINKGPVFVTRNGKPLGRSNIWREMKSLCEEAGVSPQKVFPHNLRHLFARIFYGMDKDIVKLADVLGHSSVDTTRRVPICR